MNHNIETFTLTNWLTPIKHYLSETVTKAFNQRAIVLAGGDKPLPIKPNYKMITVESIYYMKGYIYAIDKEPAMPIGTFQILREYSFYLN